MCFNETLMYVYVLYMYVKTCCAFSAILSLCVTLIYVECSTCAPNFVALECIDFLLFSLISLNIPLSVLFLSGFLHELGSDSDCLNTRLWKIDTNVDRMLAGIFTVFCQTVWYQRGFIVACDWTVFSDFKERHSNVWLSDTLVADIAWRTTDIWESLRYKAWWLIGQSTRPVTRRVRVQEQVVHS